MTDHPDQSPAHRIVALVTGAAPCAPSGGSGSGGRPDDIGDAADHPPMDDAYLESLVATAGGGDLPPPSPVLALCAAERQNDIGNARRFRHRHGDLAGGDRKVTHVENIGWFCWDGQRWAEDGDERGIRPLAQETAEMIGHEALMIVPTPEENEAIEAAASAAEKAEPIVARLEELDDDKDEATMADKKRLKRSLSGLNRIIAHGAAIEKRIQRRRTDRLRHANSSGNKGKLDGMLNEARPYVSRKIDTFDRAELDLNVDNGTLFFRVTREEDPECPDPDAKRFVTTARVGIRGHDRGDFNTKLAPVFWCPEAACPTFDAFLARIMPNENLRRYLQRFFGYVLTRRTSEQMFCIFFGGGRNGKSTLVDLIARLLGDYATTVPVASLMAENARKAQDATPDLNRIPGARFVRTSESKEGLALNEGLVKELTGGEPIMLRRLNQEANEIYPEFKLVISCNAKPRILGNDDGIWRRIALVPFDVQIPKEEVDKALPEKLWAERGGVLNWMIAGALDYLEQGGLAPPREIIEATDEYRLAEDPVGKFIMGALNVTRDPQDVIEAGRLYDGYVQWAKRFGEPVLGAPSFNRKMPKAAEVHGFAKGKASISIYSGVEFKTGFAPLDPSHTRYGKDGG